MLLLYNKKSGFFLGLFGERSVLQILSWSENMNSVENRIALKLTSIMIIQSAINVDLILLTLNIFSAFFLAIGIYRLGSPARIRFFRSAG